jgi:hypothetical protein
MDSTMQLDAIDRLAAATLEGYLVRKDLVRTFSRQWGKFSENACIRALGAIN